MRVAISTTGEDLSSPVSPVFGRCPAYIFVDTDTLEFEAVSNQAVSAPGGAGIQAAQMVTEQGAEAVITGNVGPNAFNVLSSAGVQIYLTQGGTVQQAVEALKAGQLQSLGGPSAGMHAGMGMGRGMAQGTGRGMGQGMGRGMGRGMGQGMGRGMASMVQEPRPRPFPAHQPPPLKPA
jgi:predicted Fe-Mo cluster-binding NifX family protein